MGQDPDGITYDSLNGHLYVADEGSNALTVLNAPITNTTTQSSSTEQAFSTEQLFSTEQSLSQTFGSHTASSLPPGTISPFNVDLYIGVATVVLVLALSTLYIKRKR